MYLVVSISLRPYRFNKQILHFLSQIKNIKFRIVAMFSITDLQRKIHINCIHMYLVVSISLRPYRFNEKILHFFYIKKLKISHCRHVFNYRPTKKNSYKLLTYVPSSVQKSPALQILWAYFTIFFQIKASKFRIVAMFSITDLQRKIHIKCIHMYLVVSISLRPYRFNEQILHFFT